MWELSVAVEPRKPEGQVWWVQSRVCGCPRWGLCPPSPFCFLPAPDFPFSSSVPCCLLGNTLWSPSWKMDSLKTNYFLFSLYSFDRFLKWGSHLQARQALLFKNSDIQSCLCSVGLHTGQFGESGCLLNYSRLQIILILLYVFMLSWNTNVVA